MKLIVSTTGAFGLMDLQSKVNLKKMNPHVVEMNGFINQRLGWGDLVIHAKDLPDEANDEDLQEFIVACAPDKALAVASYLSFLIPQSEEEITTEAFKALHHHKGKWKIVDTLGEVIANGLIREDAEDHVKQLNDIETPPAE